MEADDLYYEAREYAISCGARTRLQIVQDGAQNLISNLLDKYPNMKISLVTFESNVNTVIEFSSDKETIIEKIKGLKTGNMTRLGDGIKRGTDILAKSSNTNRVLVSLTDGLSNEGCEPNDAIDIAKNNGIKTISILTDGASK